MRKSLYAYSTLLLFLFLIGVVTLQSCAEDEPITEEPEEMVEEEEEDCYYVYDEELDFIYGAWVPIAVIDYVLRDTSYYEVDEGRGGFNFDTKHYSDSYELKSDSTWNLFYARVGRKCKDTRWGEFAYANDTLTFSGLSNYPPIHIPVIHLVKDTLIVEDILNKHPSKITMLRIN